MTADGWKRKTILFLISQSVTLFGSTLVQMAIVWYVAKATSSGAWVSAFSVCAYLPQFLISFVGGVWADRFDRKRLIILSDAAIAIATLVLFFTLPHIGGGRPQLLAILLVSVLRSLGAGVQMPAVNAVIPSIVPGEQLMRYNGFNATMQSVVQFAAPAAAGLVLSLSSLRMSFLIDVLTAALGVGLLGCVALPKTPAPMDGEPLFRGMRQGLRYTFSDGFLSRLLIGYGLFIFLCVPAGFLATLYVERLYGGGYAYMTAVELVGFAGMTAGGLLMGVWGGFRRRVRTLFMGLVAFGLLAFFMGLMRRFLPYLVLMLLYGVALTTVQTATTTLIQERAPAEMQGRVFGLLGAAYSGFLPLGMAVFGPLADHMDMRYIMMGSGAALVVLALALCLNKRFYADNAQ